MRLRLFGVRQTADPSVLREAWRASSRQRGWLFDEDWDHPAVDAICQGLVAHPPRVPLTAVHRLGRDRARSGVTLSEVLTDLRSVVAALGAGPDALNSDDIAELLHAGASGWEDATTGVESLGLVDGITGLATRSYLDARLRETQGVADGRVLGVIRVLGPARTSWERDLDMVLMADAIRQCFHGDHTAARLGPATAGVLTRTDGAATGVVAVVRAVQASGAGRRPQVAGWVEDLAAPLHEVLTQVDGLAR